MSSAGLPDTAHAHLACFTLSTKPSHGARASMGEIDATENRHAQSSAERSPGSGKLRQANSP